MKQSRGFSYLEVMVSFVIIVIVMQTFFIGMSYTSKSYQRLKEIEEATLYGKEVMQYMIALIEKGEEIRPEVLKAYRENQSVEMQYYQYHCIVIPEIQGGSTLKLEQLEAGLHLTTEELFDFEIFKKLYETERLKFRRPIRKEPEPLYYEGLGVQSTGTRALVVTQEQIIQKGIPLIKMQVHNGGDKVSMEISDCGEPLDPSKSIFVLWEGIEQLGDAHLEVEVVNQTACQVIIGIVGLESSLEKVQFNLNEGSQPLMIKHLSEKPIKAQRYLLLEAVTKRDETGYKVLKTYVVVK